MTRLSRSAAAAALAVTLASCGPRPAEEQLAPSNRSEPAAAAATGPAPPVAATDAMPAAMRGRWGLAAGDCKAASPRPVGLIEVEANGIRFHESRARLGKVAEIAPRRIVAEFEFQGEGETWVLRERYDLMEGGQALVRRDAGRAPRLEADLYRRCPA